MGFTLKHCLGNIKLDPSFNWKAVNDSHIFHVHSLGFLYVKREVLPRNSLFFFLLLLGNKFRPHNINIYHGMEKIEDPHPDFH